MMDAISRSCAKDRIRGSGYADQIKNNLLFILETIPYLKVIELSGREKQIIWDALMVYRDFCREHANSEHFAADVFAQIYDDVEKMQVRFYEEWKGEIVR